MKIKSMKRKFQSKISIYLLITLGVVYWYYIFVSSSTLKKIENDGTNTEEKSQLLHMSAVDSMNNFRDADISADDFNVLVQNKELKNQVFEMLKGGSSSALENNVINGSRGMTPLPSALGLTFMNRSFYLNGQPFRIFSGSIHYFRVPPASWRDRLLKLKACGLNTVETYAPWNLHEPSPGVYNFKGLLNVKAFLTLAAELGLYVIFRPGPYICSEIDFGGLPGWLLADPDMKVRTNYKGYIKAVARYFSVLLQEIIDLQFTRGGPIIMVQVENEYAVYGEDIEHLKMLTFMLKNAGIQELLATSDNNYNRPEMLFHNYALPTSNGGKFCTEDYQVIMSLNPHFPFMIMELWSGWFSAWGEASKSGRSIEKLGAAIQQVIDVGGSFNLYMFHGGTNFGFTAGALNQTTFKSFVTSYDYDALLTESGDITPKYMAVREIMAKLYKTMGYKNLPRIPKNSPKKAYGRLMMEEQMRWKLMINSIPVARKAKTLTYMEHFRKQKSANGLEHPTMGYIVYSRLNIKFAWFSSTGIQLIGNFQDRLLGIISNKLFTVLHGSNSEIDPMLQFDWDTHFALDLYDAYWDHGTNYDEAFNHHDWKKWLARAILNTLKEMRKNRGELDYRLDLVVENLGRVGYSGHGQDLLDKQRKGLNGPVFVYQTGRLYENWFIRYLTFDPDQCEQFSNSSQWVKFNPKLLGPALTRTTENGGVASDVPEPGLTAPVLFRTTLTLDQEPHDTFVFLTGWTKGVVIVNGFNLGRYWKVGPQVSLYLPASFLHIGRNEIMIFEEESHGTSILLSAQPYLGRTSTFE